MARKSELPLALCWAFIMRKSRWHKVEKIIDLGKSEGPMGLTFACLIRAKRLADMLVEPCPSKDSPNLAKIQSNSQIRARLFLM